MKKILSLLLAILTVLSLFTFATAAEEPYTITYITSDSASTGKMMAFEEVVAMYKELHPNFNMEIEYIPERSAFLQKIKILGANDELPDWFNADPDNYIEELANAGKLVDMEALYEELGVNDKFYNISKDYARLNDGRLYLMTMQCNAEYFFYNKEIFAAAGVEKVPETIDEFLEVCEKIYQAGYTPLTIGDVTGGMFMRYMAFIPFRMTGNDFIEQACAGTAKFSDEPGKLAAEFMSKIGKYMPEGFTTSDYDTFVNLFASGECAMMYNGTWVLESVVDENMNLRDEFGIFTMPTYTENDVTGASDYFANSGIGVAIRQDSMCDEMKDFMKFFFEKFPDVMLSKYSCIPSLAPSDEVLAAAPEIYQRVIKDATEVNTFSKCWDVVIDTASLDTLNSETVNLALGVITPDEWCAIMDETVAQNVLG